MPGPYEFLIPAYGRSALRDRSRLLRLSITRLRSKLGCQAAAVRPRRRRSRTGIRLYTAMIK
jgi:hypothetical protein